MNILDKLWDFVTNIFPVERWIQAIGNVLKFLSLAFILLFMLTVVFVLKEWGFTPDQRFILVLAIFVLMFLVLLFGVLLALLPGGALYSPYEQSLRRGRRYGTDKNPKTPKETTELPQESTPLALPPGEEVAGR